MPGETYKIVVGVDGSAASAAALRFAVNEARLRHSEVVAVLAWVPLSATRAPYARVTAMPSPTEEYEDAAERLSHVVDDVCGLAPRVKVRQVLIRQQPAQALLNEAEGADLLVLGGHRADSPEIHTAGPVARTCLRRQPCPIVIVAEDGEGHQATHP